MNTPTTDTPTCPFDWQDRVMDLNFPNPLFSKDAYKTGHGRQYPHGTEYVYSNLTARGAAHFPYDGFNGKVVTAGFRGFASAILHDYWNYYFFSRPLDEVVGEYQRMINSALGAEAVSVDHLVELWNLGYLPIRVKALKEGQLVNLRVPLMTIINTDPRFSWLTNFLETMWSNQTWKPITVATIAYEYRRLFERYADQTGSPRAFIPFQGHDFSARGMAGHDDSANAGVGHLFSFVGSDTLEAGLFATQHYGADWDKELIFAAPPATEHAVMCVNYAIDGETATYKRLFSEVYPTGMVAIVSDTVDLWHVLDHVAPSFKAEILAREGNANGPGKVVFRPDSGDPVKILCGDNDWPVFQFGPGQWDDKSPEAAIGEFQRLIKAYAFRYYFDTKRGGAIFEPIERMVIVADRHAQQIHYLKVTFPPSDYGAHHYGDEDFVYPIDQITLDTYQPTPAEKGAFQTLWDHFGGTWNEKGYRELDPHVGLVYGDSITLERCHEILHRLKTLGFASSNAVLGIGSFTYQYMTRDTLGLAIKATWAQVNGQGYDLQKKPATDSGVKHSAKGLMRVDKVGDDFVLHEEQTSEQEAGGELEVIFENGVLHNQQTLAEIRQRLWPTT